jgi:hypothetical protein
MKLKNMGVIASLFGDIGDGESRPCGVGANVPFAQPKARVTGRPLPEGLPQSPLSIHSLQLTLTVLHHHLISPLDRIFKLYQQVCEVVFLQSFGIQLVRPTRSLGEHIR